jgi:hypothetical protein
MTQTVYPKPGERWSTADIEETLPPLDPRIKAVLSAIGLLMTSLGGALSACGRELNRIAAG